MTVRRMQEDAFGNAGLLLYEGDSGDRSMEYWGEFPYASWSNMHNNADVAQDASFQVSRRTSLFKTCYRECCKPGHEVRQKILDGGCLFRNEAIHQQPLEQIYGDGAVNATCGSYTLLVCPPFGKDSELKPSLTQLPGPASRSRHAQPRSDVPASKTSPSLSECVRQSHPPSFPCARPERDQSFDRRIVRRLGFDS